MPMLWRDEENGRGTADMQGVSGLHHRRTAVEVRTIEERIAIARADNERVRAREERTDELVYLAVLSIGRVNRTPVGTLRWMLLDELALYPRPILKARFPHTAGELRQSLIRLKN